MAICNGTVVQILVDVLIYFALFIPYVISLVKGEPNHRGFYCNDESIRYPYHEDTVTVGMLLGACFLLPLASFIAVELPYHRVDGERRRWLLKAFKNVAKLMGLYLYGFVVAIGLTEAGKLTIGRLRPHFIDVCQPDFSKINCSQGYIEDTMCMNTESTILREARKSFPSGHATFGFYIATFLAYYYQQRIRLKFSVLLKPTLQAILILAAIFCTLSRVMDNKHHPGDVAVGALIGMLVAFWMIFSLGKLLGYRQYHVGLYKGEGEDGQPHFFGLNLQDTDDLGLGRQRAGLDECV